MLVFSLWYITARGANKCTNLKKNKLHDDVLLHLDPWQTGTVGEDSNDTLLAVWKSPILLTKWRHCMLGGVSGSWVQILHFLFRTTEM